MIGAKVDGLDIAPGTQVPEVNVMAILVCQEVFGDDAVFKLRWQSPFAAHHVVSWQIPPEIVVQQLRTPIDFPSAENVECFAIHDEDAGRSVGAINAGAAERADVNAIGAAVDGMRTRIARFAEHLFRFDDFVELPPWSDAAWCR